MCTQEGFDPMVSKIFIQVPIKKTYLRRMRKRKEGSEENYPVK